MLLCAFLFLSISSYLFRLILVLAGLATAFPVYCYISTTRKETDLVTHDIGKLIKSTSTLISSIAYLTNYMPNITN